MKISPQPKFLRLRYVVTTATHNTKLITAKNHNSSHTCIINHANKLRPKLHQALNYM